MNLVERAINKIRRAIDEVSAEITYQAALENHRGNLPVLSPADLALVESVRHEGVVCTSLEALGLPSTPLLLQASKKLSPKLPTTCRSDKNEYFAHATKAQVIEYPEIFYWGLEERLLQIVENYLGLPVAYQGSWFSKAFANPVQIGTRRWHQDSEDFRIFKIIVYLNDVSEDGGPFQYIPKHLSTALSRSLNYKPGYFIPDKRILPLVPPSDWKSCTGAAGTVIFADTASIFHRGKPPVVSDRFAIFFEYTSRRPKHPYYLKRYLNKRELLVLAKNLSENQRECVFWKYK